MVRDRTENLAAKYIIFVRIAPWTLKAGGMPRYLVVANQTAASAELRERVRLMLEVDPAARFTLLIPATPRSYLAVSEDGNAATIAQRHADLACIGLEAI